MHYASGYMGSQATGLEWECVEFVTRFYYQYYNVMPSFLGNAYDYYSKTSSSLFDKYPNDGTVAPQIGDILCSNTSTGHVGIITSVSGSSIAYVSQNFNNTYAGALPQSLKMTYSGGHYHVDQMTSALQVQGWIRKESCKTPTGIYFSGTTSTTTNLNFSSVAGALSYNINYQPVGGYWYGVSTPTPYAYITRLSPATTYNLQVQTVCGGGGTSAYSSISSFTTPGMIGGGGCKAPSGLYSYGMSCHHASIAWGSVPGCSYYKLYYWSGSSWIMFGTTTSTYAALTMSTGTTYLCVSAVCGSVETSYSSYISIIMAACKTTTNNFEEGWDLTGIEKSTTYPPDAAENASQISQNIELGIYPNPAHSYIQMKKIENAHFVITDLVGKVVKDVKNPQNCTMIFLTL